MTDSVTVEQCDRETAGDIWRDYVGRVGECMAEKAIRSGASDDTMIVQAFARHRIAERERLKTATNACKNCGFVPENTD